MNTVFSSFPVCCFVTREWKLIGINLILEYFGRVPEPFRKFRFVHFHQCTMFVREAENSWINPLFLTNSLPETGTSLPCQNDAACKAQCYTENRAGWGTCLIFWAFTVNSLPDFPPWVGEWCFACWWWAVKGSHKRSPLSLLNVLLSRNLGKCWSLSVQALAAPGWQRTTRDITLWVKVWHPQMNRAFTGFSLAAFFCYTADLILMMSAGSS